MSEKVDKQQPSAGDAKSLVYTERGVKTSADFANMMSALMTDIISGRVSPQVGNAVCNAGGKLLKIVEMQYRYGTPEGQQPKEKVLTLANG
jgi:hypothetical protein